MLGFTLTTCYCIYDRCSCFSIWEFYKILGTSSSLTIELKSLNTGIMTAVPFHWYSDIVKYNKCTKCQKNCYWIKMKWFLSQDGNDDTHDLSWWKQNFTVVENYNIYLEIRQHTCSQLMTANKATYLWISCTADVFFVLATVCSTFPHSWVNFL